MRQCVRSSSNLSHSCTSSNTSPRFISGRPHGAADAACIASWLGEPAPPAGPGWRLIRPVYQAPRRELGPGRSSCPQRMRLLPAAAATASRPRDRDRPVSPVTRFSWKGPGARTGLLHLLLQVFRMRASPESSGKRRPGRPRTARVDLAQARDLLATGASVAAVARELGVSRGALRHRLAAAG